MNHTSEASETYNTNEQAEMLLRMRRASDAFYLSAVKTGCHAFIEFTECDANHPDGGPDLNRLHCHAQWDPKLRRYVKFR